MNGNLKEQHLTIPLIDFGTYLHATDASEKQKTARAVVAGFKDVGFIYLKNHGISDSTVSDVFSQSAAFFSLPAETKDTLKWVDPRANRGYVAVGRQRRAAHSATATQIAAQRAQPADYKESMEIGRDWDPAWKNHWPEEGDVPGFKQTMLAFYQTCHALHVQVLRAVALGLGLGETFFDRLVDEQYHNLRLVSYPPIKTELLTKGGQARIGAHSDYGTVTLLFQDSVGGLEVQNPQTGEFQPVVPIAGTIVVNAGDLLARWSNDVLRSTVHRVVAPAGTKAGTTEGVTPLRRSIAFFCNPNFDTVISCLPNCGEEAKYAPVTTREYIHGRLAATYGTSLGSL